ncbi:MAG: hypothetical protein QW840_03650, partial [Candidatus Bathyarchaeia archaeon]
MEAIKLVAPFSFLAENRSEPFSEEMEKAAIYCLAELERSKGGGLLLKKTEEKLVFLAKFGYPFWLCPWNNLTLVFNGMKKLDNRFAYNNVPNVKAFIDDLHRSSKSVETYVTFLSENATYFQTLNNQKQKTVNAPILDTGLLTEIASTIPLSKPVDPQTAELALLPSAVDFSSDVSPVLQELENLRKEFTVDIDNLHESLKQASKVTRNFVKILRSEIRTIKEEYGEQIRKQQANVKPKISQINEEYDSQTTQLIKNYKKQLAPLQKEKVRLEKSKEQLLSRIERCQFEAKARKAAKDSIGEKKWEEKAKESKKEVSRIENEIKEIERKIKEIEENKQVETIRLKTERENRIKDAEKDILELEAARDAKTQSYEQEIEKLENLTAALVQKISETAKLRETDLANIERLGIAQKRQNTAMLFIPFYLACYTAEGQKRYVVFSPSTVNSVGIGAKIKSVFGGAKLKALFTERFKTMSLLLHRLPMEIEGNP